ncbi:MAG: class II aldolase/adducin family protein [Thermoproteales archaeon]|nr:class II aldolase/adducin family protein [Thermoproteales archaeon]
MEDYKKAILESVRVLYDRGITSSLSGNLSVRIPGRNAFVITPSSVPRWKMTIDDLVTMDFEGRIVDGFRKPSSEWRMHRAIYQTDEKVKAVVHAHPRFTLALSLADKLDLMEEIAEFKILFGKLVQVPYAKPGSEELANKITEYLKNTDCKAFVLERHGALVVESDIYKATALMEALEEVAEIAYLYLLTLKC